MHDILIRGMDIPKDGRKHTALLQFLEDGKCRGIVEYSKSYDDRSVKVFEVVPLPEGHGRCIEADALLSVLDILKDKGCDGPVWDQMRDIVESMVTIIPAEGGGDNG